MTLEGLKNYLRITWDDEETDKRLTGIITRAEDILSSFAGVKLVFGNSNPAECQLLLDLCRYIYNEAYEEFKLNFSAELITLRAKYAVKEMPENEEIQTR